MLSTMLRKLINGKTYSEADIIKRVNTFYAFTQINEDEYAELMDLIEEKYTN